MTAVSFSDSPKVWWSDIVSDPRMGLFKAQWKTIAADEGLRDSVINRLRARFEETLYRETPLVEGPYGTPMGRIYDGPGYFGFYMPGVALLASFMTEKKNVQGLYVCHTLEALITRLQAISVCEHDVKCAFAVGTFSSGFKKELPEDFTATPNFPQHKCLVGVKKKGKQLTIVLLDQQPTPKQNQEIKPQNLTAELWSGIDQEGQFNGQELVFRAIWKAARESKCNVRFLHSQVQRQISYGCTIFTLQAGIAFLRDPNFFDRIGCSQDVVKLCDGLCIEIITQLPPEYMIGTQSTTLIEKYRALVSQAVFDEPLLGKKKHMSLQAYLDEYRIQMVDDKAGATEEAKLPSVNNLSKKTETKEQNHYMTKKFIKYLHFVVAACEQLPSAKFQEIIARSFV